MGCSYNGKLIYGKGHAGAVTSLGVCSSNTGSLMVSLLLQ